MKKPRPGNITELRGEKLVVLPPAPRDLGVGASALQCEQLAWLIDQSAVDRSKVTWGFGVGSSVACDGAARENTRLRKPAARRATRSEILLATTTCAPVAEERGALRGASEEG